MSYFPAITIISHWFDKKKGLVIGIANAGAGIGGMALAPITRRLITNFGTRFALRIIGGYCLLGILNGRSAVGRVLLGYSSDYLGHLNTLIMCLLIASLSVLLIWPFSVKFVMLIVFSTLYGLSIGGFIAVFPTAIVGIFGRDHIATITGMVYTGFFWGLLFGPPTAGAILDSTKLTKNGIQTENFIPAMIFCGLALFFSSLILISLKLSTSKGKLLSKI
jgi:MFS family permease